MNACAICEKPIYLGGICSECWKEWTITGTHPTPEWLVELIRMHRREEGRIKEVTFTEMEMEVG